MKSKDANIIEFSKLEEISAFEATSFENCVSESFNKVFQNTDYTIIENFNDTAWPWDGLTSVDHVFVVGPGHVFSYNPDKFQKAVRLEKYNSQPIREVPFGRILEMLTPSGRLHLTGKDNLDEDDLLTLGITKKPLGVP